jgi:hypothetical protein
MDITFYTYVDDINRAIEQSREVGLSIMDSEMIDKYPKSVTLKLFEEFRVCDDVEAHKVCIKLIEREEKPKEQFRFEEFDFWGMEHALDTNAKFQETKLAMDTAFGYCNPDTEISSPYKRQRYNDINGYRTFISGPRFKPLDYSSSMHLLCTDTLLTEIEYCLRVVIQVHNIDESMLHYEFFDFSPETHKYSVAGYNYLELTNPQLRNYSLVLAEREKCNIDKFTNLKKISVL